VQIPLDFGAIRFKFHDQINQRPINFQSAIEDEVTQLGSNRGVRLAIANQLVVRSGTEVHQD
jgi:hypothetical protein